MNVGTVMVVGLALFTSAAVPPLFIGWVALGVIWLGRRRRRA